MSEQFSEDIEQVDNLIYYLIPLNSCDPCVRMNIKSLSTLKSSIVRPILIGKLTSNTSDLQLTIGKIESQMDCLLDASNSARQFEMGLSKPLLIHIKNGKCIHFQLIDDFSVDKAFDYISNN